MSIINISSDVYEEGRKIAQKTAEAMGYAYVGREILRGVAEKYHLSETKLVDAIDKAAPTLRMSLKLRKQLMAYIQEAVLGEMLKDNIVCQGLAAHLYVLGVSHVLKVRILIDPEERARNYAQTHNMSVKKAEKLLAREKKLRQQWSFSEFRFDETDPSKYDLMVSLSQIDPDEAVRIITETVCSRKFQPMNYSEKCLKDLELAARVRVLLMDKYPSSRVQANGGNLIIETLGLTREKRKREAAIKELAENIPGVNYVEVHFIHDFFRQAAESFR